VPDYLDYPFAISAKGRTATTDVDDHVRDMIYQVLFTSPGERVNRPDFGCGLLQLIFELNSPEAAASARYLVRGALQRWLGQAIDVDEVTVTSQDERLTIDIVYVRLDTGELHHDQFSSPQIG
jgi:phage baseplate assembly protein W